MNYLEYHLPGLQGKINYDPEFGKKLGKTKRSED